jgi:hypothetical protein
MSKENEHDEYNAFYDLGYTTPDEALEIRKQRQAHDVGEQVAKRTVVRSAKHDPDYAGERDIGTEDMQDGVLSDEQARTNDRGLDPITIENIARNVRKIRRQQETGELSDTEAEARVEKLRQQYPNLFEDPDESL